MSIRPGLDRGLTLVEVLVAAGLGILVLALVGRLLLSSFDVTKVSTLKLELQQKRTVLNNRFNSDLGLTTKSGLGIEDVPLNPRISIHLRRVDPAVVSWQDRVIFYQLQGTTLTRAEHTLPNVPTRAFKPQVAADWNALFGLPQRVSLRLENVTSLEASIQNGPLVKLRVLFQKKDHQLTLERLFFLRQGT